MEPVQEDDAGASVLADEDWAPAAEIIRHLARKTVAHGGKDYPHSSQQSGPLSTNDAMAASPSYRIVVSSPSPEKPTGHHVRLQFDDDKEQSYSATLDTTMPLSRTSLSRTQSATSDEWMAREGDLDFSDGGFPGGAEGSSPRRSRSSPGTPANWKNAHDVPWDGSVFKPKSAGLYQKATPKVCCCLRVFEPGVNRCIKCGERRPVPAPDKVNQTVKALHAQDPHMHHPEPYERNYLWAAVYDQRKYNLQLASHEDEEEFVHTNGHFNPQLNEKSMEITDNMDIKPIHERTEDILFKRNEYLTMRRQMVYDAEVCKECTFCPRLHPKSVGMHGRDRRSLFRWENRRAHKINQALNNQLEVEAEHCRFVPELSVASRRLAEEYSNRNVHDRLVQDARRRRDDMYQEQEIQKKLTPSAFSGAQVFSPKKATFDLRANRVQSARPHSAHAGHRSARAGQNSPLSQMGSFSPSPRSQTRSASPPKAKAAPQFDNTRASCVVLPNGPIPGGSPDSRSVRAKKAANSGKDTSSKNGYHSRMTRSYSLSPEKAPVAPPKSVLLNGKNTVKFQSHFAELIWNIHTNNPYDE